MSKATRTTIGKVISGVTGKAGSYGRHLVGRPISHTDLPCATRYNMGWLSVGDMENGCYSVEQFKRGSK